jgi:cation transport regulator ChaC
MMGLRRGGRCVGMVHRIPDDDRHDLLVRLLRREMAMISS